VSIIEQAAKRLEELRRAGIEVPGVVGSDVASQGAPTRATEAESPFRTPEAKIARPVGGPVEAGLVQVLPHERGKLAGAAPQRRSKEVTIDLGRLGAAGYITPDAPRSQLADEFRVIKRPLLTNVQGKSPVPVAKANLIMLTSSVPGEGKTFTAINLALSIAMELDNHVLLVDADPSRPAVLDRLGLPTSTGLLDLLMDSKLDVADVLLRTNIDRLTILPVGTPQSRATELLASDGMNRLLDELSTRYADRIVVFDGPPLLPSTESRVLASHVGQVVVVVEADRTPQGTLTQALAMIESCPVVMLTLNKVRRSEVGSYFSYYGY
jgi:exopolysaccharide/PEP-CTERM locus tyrosine autokinase